MNTFSKFIVFLIFAGSIAGCSRKKNNFISRHWHAVTTEYNTLYNGNLALEQGREELIQNYEDNFWDILPIERMQIDEQITLPDSVKNQNFGIAEEKAVKAIQRHSMLIEGKERNPQIDEAYLLLGKARYFDQRFIPALEAFNYILHKYPASNNINHAQIWREKTNLRLDNQRLAIRNLKRILEVEDLEGQNLADANATLAQAYINQTFIDSALAPLRKAAEATPKNEEKGRYYFILGQLHDRMGQPDRANAVFDEVIALNRKSPRVYMINAYVQKAQNFKFQKEENYRLKEMLTELEEDRENRPFLDKIYFQIAEYYKQLDSTERAVVYYNKSLAEPASDKFLRSVNYEILADMNFDNANYRQASKYYDSTLAEMGPRLREYRTIKKKRDNLDEVILYEEMAATNDSILMLANLSEEEQVEYFTAHTESLKIIASAENISGNAEIGLPQSTASAGETRPPSTGGARDFYFYNESRVENGKREFTRVWGNRSLSDNWRLGSQAFMETDTTEEAEIAAINFEDDPRFDPMTYVAQIPEDPQILDSIFKERNEAWFHLGVIYKEKYKEYDMAAGRLEALLKNRPEEQLILPAKYHLYEIYDMSGRSQERERFKQDILNNYPDSRYAAFIRNPESRIQDENSPNAVYGQVYKKFQDQQYDEVLAETTRYIDEYAGEEILPKFDLLKATATGRLLGLEAYENALNYVAVTYPQTEEGKKAQDILNNTIPELSQMQFNRDTLQENFKLVYRFDIAEKEEASALKEKINTALSNLDYDLKTSVDIYDPSTVFVVVHGLENNSRALGFAELLQNEEYKVAREAIAISTENYRIAQIHKNFDIFLEPEN